MTIARAAKRIFDGGAVILPMVCGLMVHGLSWQSPLRI
jgi:hypothetical protein